MTITTTTINHLPAVERQENKQRYLLKWLQFIYRLAMNTCAYGIDDILKQNNVLRVRIKDDINNIPGQDLLIQLPQSINEWDKFIEGIETLCILTELVESYKDKGFQVKQHLN